MTVSYGGTDAGSKQPLRNLKELAENRQDIVAETQRLLLGRKED
jgi:hypothetical protein